MDRSQFHILLCDLQPPSSLPLLHRCSYQVTSVKSAQEIIDLLSSSHCPFDLILSDVELPLQECYKMLKFVRRQERLRHIPVVVMSERDEMSVVARCLQLGAVDYLVKPLRSNEVLNLWTHLWRRRRMLGLPDKHAISGNLNLPMDSILSDTGQSYNAPLFPEEIDDKICKISAQAIDAGPPTDLEPDSSPPLELSLRLSCHHYPEKKLPNPGPKCLSPKTVELKGSSAFVTYAKALKQSSEQSANVDSNSNQSVKREKVSKEGRASELESADSGSGTKNSSVTENGSSPSCAYLCSEQPQPSLHYDSSSDVLAYHQQFQGFTANSAAPAKEMHQGGFINSSGTPQGLQFQFYPAFPQESMPQYLPSRALGMGNAFAYYPFAQISSSQQFVAFPTWPAMVAAPANTGCKMTQAERREAAIHKFRMKRKERCFEKKIRYASRKKLAEQRPRIRGQFVRRADVMENGNHGDGFEYDDDEELEYADDEQGCSELETPHDSSPESLIVGCCGNG